MTELSHRVIQKLTKVDESYRDVVEYTELVLGTPEASGFLSSAFVKFTRTDRG
ncbi:hypothetical protein T190607A01A_11065 [Tenacibaculum sp. 190524A05c]|uniref:Uncharacterized protein n=1 Tax=Tenacibaculum platacis TaxID=3137852 RepID=A0ABP1EI68_9FLAO